MATSLATARRDEFDHLALKVLSGAVPADIAGHAFVVGAVGNVGSSGFPGPDHDSAINGDGMIYRFDISAGQAHVRTRLVRGADYYADDASERDPRYARLAFLNAGILRISPWLGARDYGNTAFLGFELQAPQPRLLMTFDGGRPLEVDTRSLEVATPLGAVEQWRAEAMAGVAFPPVLCTAHPVADEATSELFLVNYGRSAGSILLRSLPLALGVSGPQFVRELLSDLASLAGQQARLDLLSRAASDSVRLAGHTLAGLFPGLAAQIPDEFTHLVRWDGAGGLEHFRVVLPDDTPVQIGQTMHQLAVTRNWVVLMDTSMKLTMDQTYNTPLGRLHWLDRLLRAATTSPQQAVTKLYFIPRAALMAGGGPASPKDVVARQLVLPMECVHFHTDYDDGPSGADVVLHIAHNCAQDVAEWVRGFDRDKFAGAPSPPAVWGVPNVSPLDIHRLARYEVHAPTGLVKTSRIISDDKVMWGLSLYAARGIHMNGPLPDRLHSMYHVTTGYQPELVTRFIYELYEYYPHRMTSLEQLRRMVHQGGRPSTIFHVDLDSYEVDDAFALPQQGVGGSIQFIPRTTGGPGPRDGYLMAMVIDDGARQIWLFDAADLAAGPVCKLGHPDLVFGATLHSWWLESVAPRTSSYHVPPRQDYAPRIAGDLLIEQMFEDHVYPHFAP